jgi:hypothetical protein
MAQIERPTGSSILIPAFSPNDSIGDGGTKPGRNTVTIWLHPAQGPLCPTY